MIREKNRHTVLKKIDFYQKILILEIFTKYVYIYNKFLKCPIQNIEFLIIKEYKPRLLCRGDQIPISRLPWILQYLILQKYQFVEFKNAYPGKIPVFNYDYCIKILQFLE